MNIANVTATTTWVKLATLINAANNSFTDFSAGITYNLFVNSDFPIFVVDAAALPTAGAFVGKRLKYGFELPYEKDSGDLYVRAENIQGAALEVSYVS